MVQRTIDDAFTIVRKPTLNCNLMIQNALPLVVRACPNALLCSATKYFRSIFPVMCSKYVSFVMKAT
jgi:hypothetical protein